MSIDHLGLVVPASKLDAEVAFLNAALSSLGLKEQLRMLPLLSAFGPSAHELFLWVTGIDEHHKPILAEGEDGENGAKGVKMERAHLAFRAKNRKEVDAFHAAALRAGGECNGKPGLRENYHPNYYAAFVIDPCGNNIEAVVHHNNE